MDDARHRHGRHRPARRRRRASAATPSGWPARSATSSCAITANCAARTLVADIPPIVEISQRAGIPIEACLFIGSSPIRQYAEDWTLERLLQATAEAITFAVEDGLPVMYVTEDTTRSRPEALRRSSAARSSRRVARSASATPSATRRRTACATSCGSPASVIDEAGRAGRHRLARPQRSRPRRSSTRLAAIEAGADRVHGTALGIGERVGNAPMDLLLVNLKLLG